MNKRRGHLLVNIGYGNAVVSPKVIAIPAPGSASMLRRRDDEKERGMPADAVLRSIALSIVITDRDRPILTADLTETPAERLSGGGAA